MKALYISRGTMYIDDDLQVFDETTISHLFSDTGVYLNGCFCFSLKVFA